MRRSCPATPPRPHRGAHPTLTATQPHRSAHPHPRHNTHQANFEKVQAFKREFEERNGRLPSFAEMALADKEIADIARRLGEFGMDA